MTLKSIISIFLTLILLSCCSSDCDDIKIGDIDPPEYVSDYAVYEQGQSVSFSNEQGDTYTFIANIFDMPGRLNITEIGTASDPQNGSFSCYEYKSTYGPLIQLIDASERHTILLQFYTRGDTEESLEYIANMSVGWNEPVNPDNEVESGFSQSEYNMTTNEIIIPSGSTFQGWIIDIWQGNNLSYENVINISSETNEFFFKDGVGFVAFTRMDGELFTLDN